MNKYLIHLIIFPLFFTLFYIESISIGGLKIAIVWKLLFIGFIVLYLLANLSSFSKIQKFVLFGYLYSLKNMFTLSTLHYFIGSLGLTIKILIIPILAQFFSILQQARNINLYQLLLTVSIYIIISSIPFLLGLLDPLTKGYDLSLFGDEAYGFVGIFQVPHAAAVTIAFAIIILMYEIQFIEKKNKKIFYFILILLGLWIEIQTFARTGFAALFVASSYLFLFKKKFLYYLKLLPLVIILFFTGWQYYQSSTILQMRVEGTNKYLEQSESESRLGSGRLVFATAALENWSNSGVEGILFGMGFDKAKDMMYESIGMRIVSHNGFIDVIQFNGLIGVFLYLLFLYYLFIYIKIRKKAKYAKLAQALFLGYLTATLFQGEHFFLADFLFAVCLALIADPVNDIIQKYNAPKI